MTELRIISYAEAVREALIASGLRDPSVLFFAEGIADPSAFYGTVKGIAEQLETMRQQGRFDRLIIAAAPSALGDLRPALSDQVKQTIMAELPKDLTNVPKGQLERHFEQLLPV